MNNIEIWLDKIKLDTNDIDLALTYSYSNVYNPLNIVGDYSKTFTIQGNQTNNAAFGQSWNFDRAIIDNPNIKAGVYFNPSKRVPCKIYMNGGLWKSGYLKLNAVNIDKGVYSYDVTFYSQICMVLHDLQNRKLKDLKYYQNLEHQINRQTIADFWNDEHLLRDYMNYAMCNNGLYADFESSKMLQETSSGAQVVNIADGLELDECSTREYRSYYQRPALRINKMIKNIIDEYNYDGDYSQVIELNGNFFNYENPYWENSVLTLPQYNVKDDVKVENYTADGPYSFISLQPLATGSTSITYGGNEYLPAYSRADLNVEFEVEIEAYASSSAPFAGVGEKLYGNNAMSNGQITALLLDEENGSQERFEPYSNYDNNLYFGYSSGYFEAASTTRAVARWFNNVYPDYKTNSSVLNRFPMRQKLINSIGGGDTLMVIEAKNLPKQLYSSVTQRWINIDHYVIRIYPITKLPTTGNFNANNYIPYSAGFTGVDLSMQYNAAIGSNSVVRYSDMVDDETTQGDILINYCKLFGLVFDVDGEGNIEIMDKNTFFRDYKILDWEDKIDYSKPIMQTPITFDKKYLNIGYTPIDSHYEKIYKNKYTTDYGAARINTGYEFNSDSENIISDNIFNTTVMSKESTRMAIGSEFKFMKDEKVLPAFFTLENGVRNPVETKYNLLFDNGIKNLTTPIYISDDVAAMFDENNGGGQRCWLDTNNEIITDNAIMFNKYRQFSTVWKDGDLSWDIGYPSESYAGYNNINYQPSSTIYRLFWDNYIREIYNVDNKMVKCHVRLTDTDMFNFSFKNFVYAFGCIWHPNKINNYNPQSDGTTEVELIKVDNMSAYTSGQKSFQIEYFVEADTENATLVYDRTKPIHYGDTFYALIEVYPNTEIVSVNVNMANKNITSTAYKSDTNEIIIEKVTGDIVIEVISE